MTVNTAKYDLNILLWLDVPGKTSGADISVSPDTCQSVYLSLWSNT